MEQTVYLPHCARKTHDNLAHSANALIAAAKDVFASKDGPVLFKCHFGLTEDWLCLLNSEQGGSVAAPRQTFRETFHDTRKLDLARQNLWLRCREEATNEGPLITWSLKAPAALEGTYFELKDQKEIYDRLCNPQYKLEHDVPIRTTSSLAKLFPYRLGYFETQRVCLYHAVHDYTVHVDWVKYFGGDYYMVGTIKFTADKTKRFSPGQFHPKKIIQPVPSKIVEFLRRYSPKTFALLSKQGIIPKLPYKYAAKHTRYRETPKFFQQRDATSFVAVEDLEEFKQSYLDESNQVKPAICDKLKQIKEVIGYGVGSIQTAQMRWQMAIYVLVNQDPATVCSNNPELSKTPFHLIGGSRGLKHECSVYAGQAVHWIYDTNPCTQLPECSTGSLGALLRGNDDCHYGLTAWHCVDPPLETSIEEASEQHPDLLAVSSLSTTELQTLLGPEFLRLATNFEKALQSHMEKPFHIELDGCEYERCGRLVGGAYSEHADVAAFDITSNSFDCCHIVLTPEQDTLLPSGQVYLLSSTQGGSIPAQLQAVLNIENGAKLLLFTSVSQGGDSGGLWYYTVEDKTIPLGLHRGRLLDYSIANPMSSVLEQLANNGLHLQFCSPDSCERQGEEEEEEEEAEEEEEGEEEETGGSNEDEDDGFTKEEWLQLLQDDLSVAVAEQCASLLEGNAPVHFGNDPRVALEQLKALDGPFNRIKTQTQVLNIIQAYQNAHH